MTSKMWLHVAGLIVVGWLLGLAHGALSAIIPSIKLDLLLLAGMVGAMAGVIKGFGAIAFEDDRPKPLPLFGLLLGGVALMGSWCGWVWAATDWEHFLPLHPFQLINVVCDIAAHGEYTASSSGGSMKVTVAQASVKWAWICEAVTLALAPCLSAVFWVFERRDTWTGGQW